MISYNCLRMRASQAIHSPENAGEDDSMAFRAHSDSLLNGRGSDPIAAPSGRVGGRPRFSTRGFRQPRCVPHCSHLIAAAKGRRCRLKGVLLDELPLLTGLAPQSETNSRAEPCEALYATDASPSGAGGCSAFCRGKKGSMFVLFGKAKNHRATCTMGVQPPRRLL